MRKLISAALGTMLAIGLGGSMANAAGEQKPPPKFDYNTCVAKLQKTGASPREATYRCNAIRSGAMKK